MTNLGLDQISKVDETSENQFSVLYHIKKIVEKNTMIF